MALGIHDPQKRKRGRQASARYAKTGHRSVPTPAEKDAKLLAERERIALVVAKAKAADEAEQQAAIARATALANARLAAT